MQGLFLNETTLFTLSTYYSSPNLHLIQILHFKYNIFTGLVQFDGKSNGPQFNESDDNCLAKLNDTSAIIVTKCMEVYVINVATNSTKKIQSLQTIDIGTIKACAAFQRRNKMMVIVSGAVMTALLDLSTKDGNWTIGLISFLILAKFNLIHFMERNTILGILENF